MLYYLHSAMSVSELLNLRQVACALAAEAVLHRAKNTSQPPALTSPPKS